jgi:hypothetical protein
MASAVEIDSSCIPAQPSRLVYIIAPGTLVRIGPDLDEALAAVIASIQAAIVSPRKPSHFATTYSRANITIVVDCFESDEDVQLQVYRLLHKQKGNRLLGYPDPGLSARIADQLREIEKQQPQIQIPFTCVEDWRGVGPKDHQIYDQMAKASRSLHAWQDFKNAVSSSFSCILNNY